MEPFYKKFREAFRSSKYNQDAVLAKDLDVDPIYISTMRSGRRTPGRKIAAKIATKLDLDYEQLLRSIECQKAPDYLKKDFEKTEHLKVSVAAKQGQTHTIRSLSSPTFLLASRLNAPPRNLRNRYAP